MCTRQTSEVTANYNVMFGWLTLAILVSPSRKTTKFILCCHVLKFPPDMLTSLPCIACHIARTAEACSCRHFSFCAFRMGSSVNVYLVNSVLGVATVVSVQINL